MSHHESVPQQSEAQIRTYLVDVYTNLVREAQRDLSAELSRSLRTYLDEKVSTLDKTYKTHTQLLTDLSEKHNSLIVELQTGLAEHVSRIVRHNLADLAERLDAHAKTQERQRADEHVALAGLQDQHERLAEANRLAAADQAAKHEELSAFLDSLDDDIEDLRGQVQTLGRVLVASVVIAGILGVLAIVLALR